MKCLLCPNEQNLEMGAGEPGPLCRDCRLKMMSKIAVVCMACDRVYWLPKTPDNVTRASEMSGMSVKHIMENGVLHQISGCRNCPTAPDLRVIH